MIGRPDVFCAAVQAAIPLAEQGKLVTFGIVPTEAETGYGYIQQGVDAGQGATMVKAFVEKPSLELAEQYLVDGRYLWNSGMFFVQSVGLFTRVGTTLSADGSGVSAVIATGAG